ncbi:MAG: hypothetical protein AB7O95_20910 [Geminicoccaceae bacterium]
MRRLTGLLVGLLLSGIAGAQVSSTRETAYDWACCEDAECVTRTVHQRYDTAFVACLNKSIADGATRWVQGGRYRVVATVAPPPVEPPPAEEPPAVATATLHWTEPTTNVDGTPLTDLVGYRVRYWRDSANPLVATIPDPLAATASVGLPEFGVWNFALAAVNAAGIESAYTEPVSREFR